MNLPYVQFPRAPAWGHAGFEAVGDVSNTAHNRTTVQDSVEDSPVENKSRPKRVPKPNGPA